MAAPVTFADWFKQQIEAREWTYSEVARRCQIGRSYVRKLKAGQRQPSPLVIAQISEGFGTVVPDRLTRQPPTNRGAPAPNSEAVTFADWFDSNIRANGWTYEQAAAKIGVEQSRLYRLRTGKRGPSAAVVRRTADAFRVDPPPQYRGAMIDPRHPVPVPRHRVAPQTSTGEHVYGMTQFVVRIAQDADTAHGWRKHFEAAGLTRHLQHVELAKAHLDLAAHYLKQAAK